MPYGILKCDQVTFTNAGVDQTISVSGIVASISGNITATGTISGNVIRGGTTVSGATVTGNAGQFNTITGNTASFTTVSGTNITGDTVTFASGLFLGNLSAGAFVPIGNTVPTNGVYLPAANNVAVATNGTGRLFVASDGSVGIGQASDNLNYRLNIYNSSTDFCAVSIGNNVSGSGALNGLVLAQNQADSLFINRENGYMSFSTNNSEKLRITSGGLVGVGTSAPGAGLHIATAGQTTSALDTSGSLNLLVSDTGASAGNGGSIVFGFNSGSGRFASIKGQVITGAGNSTGHLTFSTRNATSDATLTERLRITNDGLLGVGTTSPGSIATGYGVVHVSGANGGGVVLGASGYVAGSASGVEFGTTTNNPVTFFSNNAERARIDSSGRLLVGTSTARAQFLVTPQFEVEGTSSSTSSIGLINNQSTNAGPYLFFGRTRGTAVGGVAAVQLGDILGGIYFQGANGTDLSNCGASIESYVDAEPFTSGDTTDLPSRLVFSTTADGASSPTERMRITSTGQVRLAGAGITFNGDTAAANELDDYEEGTWTPTIIGVSSAGTGTYAVQQAKYTKIGRIVYIQARIDWTAHTGTGTMRISGLPFAVSSSASTPAISIVPDRMTSPASTFPQAYALNSTSNIVIVSTTIAGGGESLLNMDTDAGIRVGGWYEV